MKTTRVKDDGNGMTVAVQEGMTTNRRSPEN